MLVTRQPWLVLQMLTNGNYVVASSFWDNGAIVNAGASTWCNGNGGTVGPVSSSNPLIGSKANDIVGSIITLKESNL